MGLYRSQTGRSMVEILGTLSIMGILSLVGLKMYHSAVNSHRANELIYEANKRVTIVAAQLMAGRSGDQLSIAEFTDPAGHTFGVEVNPKNANQFNITITGVDSEVCQKMKNAVGDGTAIRVISEFCDKLTYNNDLSQTSYVSDIQDSAECTTAGHTWCSQMNNGQCQEASNCCSNQTVTPCQICNEETGALTNQPEYYGCDSDGDAVVDGYCNSSAVCTLPATKVCATNADCTGLDGTYYCRYKSYNSSVSLGYCTQDVVNAMGGKVGICTEITSNDYTVREISGFGVGGGSKVLLRGKLSHASMWWNARNFCEAVSELCAHPGGGNWSLIDISGNRLGCYDASHTVFGEKTVGYCCSATATTCDDDVTNQSPMMQALRNTTTGFGIEGTNWTTTAYGSCHGYYVNFTNGKLGYNALMNPYYALCE